MTNITIAYFLIFFMVIKLSIYAIHGTSTNYNDLGSTVKSGVSKVYASTAKAYQNSNRQQVKREVKRQDIKEQAKIKRGAR
jgi:hypothetical protein